MHATAAAWPHGKPPQLPMPDARAARRTHAWQATSALTAPAAPCPARRLTFRVKRTTPFQASGCRRHSISSPKRSSSSTHPTSPAVVPARMPPGPEPSKLPSQAIQA